MGRLSSIIAALLVIYVLDKVVATKQESTVYIHQEDQDTEPPRITCPKNIKVMKNTAGPVVPVYWPLPHYEDNSEQPVTLFTESVQGSGFRVGQHFIKYEARDQAGNTAFCTFNITVTGLRCPSYSPPSNGLLACAPLASLGGTVCTPQCNDNKDFSRIPANLYICQPETGRWNVWDFRPTVSRMLPWPHCTGGKTSGFRRKGELWQSLKGSCAGNPTAQRQAKKNLIRGIKATLGGSVGLLEKDVHVMCGKTGDKRSVADRYENVGALNQM